MIEIKFRAKSAATGKWVYGYPVPFPDGISGWALVGDMFYAPQDGHIGTSMYFEVLNDTIGAYCGFTDYFNTPAYDGDIISVDPDLYGIIRYGQHKPSVLHSEKTACGFYVEWLGERSDTYRTNIGYWLSTRGAVIRGNIFDNPEIVEAAK